MIIGPLPKFHGTRDILDECFDAICFSYLLRYVDEPQTSSGSDP